MISSPTRTTAYWEVSPGFELAHCFVWKDFQRLVNEGLIVQRSVDEQFNIGGCSGKAGENNCEAANDDVAGAQVV